MRTQKLTFLNFSIASKLYVNSTRFDVLIAMAQSVSSFKASSKKVNFVGPSRLLIFQSLYLGPLNPELGVPPGVLRIFEQVDALKQSVWP